MFVKIFRTVIIIAIVVCNNVDNCNHYFNCYIFVSGGSSVNLRQAPQAMQVFKNFNEKT